MSTSASSSTSTPPPVAGPSSQTADPLNENNEEKNRYAKFHSLCARICLTVKRTSVVIKVGMVGDSQIGKTSLMVKYVEGSFDEDYIQTLGEYL